MKICVVGARGFLGSNLVRHLSSRGHQVTSLSHSNEKPIVRGSTMWTDFDDLQKALISAHPEVLINAAAITDFDICEQNFELATRVNALLPAKLAEFAIEFGSFLLHTSTDAIHEETLQLDSTEDSLDKIGPARAYFASKLAGDQAIVDSGHREFCIVRTSFYGSSTLGRLSFLDYCVQSFSRGEQIFGYTDYFTSSIYVGTLNRAIEQVALRKTKGILPLGTRDSFSKCEFAIEVAKAFGFEAQLVQPVLSPKGTHSFGGRNAAVISKTSWEALDMQQPTLQGDLRFAKLEFSRVTPK